MTQIGERGINISGGQKQRIAIARAVYNTSDIYLIDDALSALDADVSKKVMRDIFKGELKNTSRIMVTHKIKLLDQVDRVLLFKDGTIVASGPFEEVKKT
jgi:ABC-type multidrug transport system fused ATPase/permease subunit